MNTDQKPGLITGIAVMTLTSGIINLFWGYLTSVSVLSTIIGVVCLPITILPTILGVFEIIYGAKLLSNPSQPLKASPALASFQIASIVYGNVFSTIVGILNLIFFNDQVVKEYFARINGVQIFSPTPVAPATPSIPQALPEPVEPILPEPTSEQPEKPKRGRKVAGK